MADNSRWYHNQVGKQETTNTSKKSKEDKTIWQMITYQNSDHHPVSFANVFTGNNHDLLTRASTADETAQTSAPYPPAIPREGTSTPRPKKNEIDIKRKVNLWQSKMQQAYSEYINIRMREEDKLTTRDYKNTILKQRLKKLQKTAECLKTELEEIKGHMDKGKIASANSWFELVQWQPNTRQNKN